MNTLKVWLWNLRLWLARRLCAGSDWQLAETIRLTKMMVFARALHLYVLKSGALSHPKRVHAYHLISRSSLILARDLEITLNVPSHIPTTPASRARMDGTVHELNLHAPPKKSSVQDHVGLEYDQVGGMTFSDCNFQPEVE